MATDPYRYFRIEAQELLDGLSRGLIQLEKGGNRELVRELLRQAHTLKGAARVVKQPEVGEWAHHIEDLLSPYREKTANMQRTVVDSALKLLDRIRERVSSLGGPPQLSREGGGAKEAREKQPLVDEGFSTVRVGIDEMDGLLEGISEAVAATSRLRREGQFLDEAWTQAGTLLQDLDRHRGLEGSPRVQSRVEAIVAALERARKQVLDRSDAIGRELAELRRMASELRLVPAHVLLTELERATRDAAQSLGKQVIFQSTGAEIRLDAHVLSGLRGALRHLVRNAVAHGLEEESTRVKAGKPPAGTVEVLIERRGHRVFLVCRDDGRGLDVDAVRRVAVERGMIPEASARNFDVPQLVDMLLRGGLSTARTVTDVSGRGVGLDVVRQAVERLRGEVDIRTSVGKGTTVELVVPISLSSMPALSMEVDGDVALAPLDSVRRALRLREQDISQTADGERIVVDGAVIPFISLRRVLRGSARRDDTRVEQSAVVLESSGRLAAIGVDRLRDIETIIVRSLPEHAADVPVIAGAVLDDEGIPRLVLAPGAVVQAAAQAKGIPDAPRAATRLPLLVIDDSLTTRMLEQSILESAGYDVDLAVSAEDALRKAKERQYGLFIVDVEMPGMNGFEFIAHTRGDPDLREIPSILVTSQAAPEDKRRGKDVGARAYIVKSEFDQQELLEVIRRLVG